MKLMNKIKNMEAIPIEVVLCVNRINILHQKKAWNSIMMLPLLMVISTHLRLKVMDLWSGVEVLYLLIND